MSINQSTEAALEDYLNLAVSPRFAVLLDGPWGVGKTSLVKRLVENLRSKGRKVIYVSLYGLTQTSQIDQLIYQELHPFLGSRRARQFGRVFAGMLQATLKVDLGAIEPEVKIAAPKIQVDKPPDGEDHILIFDDFERCAIETRARLGYINYFVEHSGLRVVVCANESQLFAELPDYGIEREKLFGLCLRLEPEFEAAFDVFTRELSPDVLGSRVRKMAALAAKVFALAGHGNLRAVRQSLLMLQRVYSRMPETARSNEAFFSEFFQLYLALTLENSANPLQDDEIAAIAGVTHTSQLIREMQRQREDQSTPDTRASRASKKYSSIFSNNTIASQSPEFWKPLIKSGRIELEVLSDMISSNPLFQEDSTPAWKKLWWWYKLEQRDLDTVLATVLGELERGEIKNVYEVLHATLTILDLAEKGLVGELQPSAWVDQARAYFSKLSGPQAFSRTDGEDPDRLEFWGYQGLGFETRLPESKQLVEYAKDAFLAYRAAANREHATRMAALLREDPQLFADQIHFLSNRFQKGFPFFATLSAGDFVKDTKRLNTAGIWRTVSDGINEYLQGGDREGPHESELPFFRELAQLLNAEMEGARGTVRHEGLTVFRREVIDYALKFDRAKS